MTLKRYLLPLLVSLTLLAGAARAEAPAIPSPKELPPASGIGGSTLALALAAGAGVGAMGALLAGETLLTVGAGTVVAIYVGHLLLEAVVVGGALYVWPEGEEAEEPTRRPSLFARRKTDKVELRLVATH